MKSITKTFLLSLALAVLTLAFVACGDDEHTHSAQRVPRTEATCTSEGNIEYFSCEGCELSFADAECTEEVTETKLSRLAHTPEADDGDCTTAVKCANCEKIMTEAKPEHISTADDGDCTTAVKCANCEAVMTEAKPEHIPDEDDGDCTTAVKCASCEEIMTEAKASHTPAADDGDCTTAVKCANCEEIMTEAKPEHIPDADDGDCTTSVPCTLCDKNAVEARSAHTPDADDGDCTTAVKCIYCDEITVEAKASHTPEADDGTCLTAQKCSGCEQIAIEARSAHADGDVNSFCDHCTTKLNSLYNEETGTLHIYTLIGLYEWMDRSYSYYNKKISLEADIALPDALAFDVDGDGTNDSNWMPAYGTSSFYGNNHSITGIIAHGDNFVGFFSQISEGCVVRDLILIDVDVKGEVFCGAITGYNNGTIEGCSVLSGTVYGTSSNIGGISGTLSSEGSIIGCYNGADVSSENGSVGGIVGQHASGLVIGCYNTGNIVAKKPDGTAGSSIGGIVGSLYGGNIYASYSLGSIKGDRAGLICGYIDRDVANLTKTYWYSTDEATAGVGNQNQNLSDDCHKVDGDIISWADAAENMNGELEARGLAWRFTENTGEGAPLILVKLPTNE